MTTMSQWSSSSSFGGSLSSTEVHSINCFKTPKPPLPAFSIPYPTFYNTYPPPFLLKILIFLFFIFNYIF